MTRFFASGFSTVFAAAGAVLGLIVASETSIFVARLAWQWLGPLALIFTGPLWLIYPI